MRRRARIDFYLLHGSGGGAGQRTNLSPDHLGQCANELGRCVSVPAHTVLVDHFADCEPQGGLELLCGRLARRVWVACAAAAVGGGKSCLANILSHLVFHAPRLLAASG